MHEAKLQLPGTLKTIMALDIGSGACRPDLTISSFLAPLENDLAITAKGWLSVFITDLAQSAIIEHTYR